MKFVLYMVPRVRILTHNGHPDVEKMTFENLKMFNTPGVFHLPILGQTNDGCMYMALVGSPEIKGAVQ